MNILYSDNRILVCLKPYGIVSTDEPGGLPSLIREQLGDDKACVRTVHRLDQVVGGVMVLARSKKAAQLLSGQVQERSFGKEYLAVVHGTPEPRQGTFCDLLFRIKEQRKTIVVTESGKDVQEAVLDYETLEEKDGLSLVKIHLRTGRTHQIRAQFSHHSCPLVGDAKYGAPEQPDMEGIALWSRFIAIDHPQTGARMEFEADPPPCWPWNHFDRFTHDQLPPEEHPEAEQERDINMDIWETLYKKASALYHPNELSPFVYANHVVCALEAENGQIFTGVCIESCSGVVNLCAERAAAVNMIVNSGQTVVKRCIAFRDTPPSGGGSGMPCGACREFFLQLSEKNKDMEIMYDYAARETVTLGELMPNWWGWERYTASKEQENNK